MKIVMLGAGNVSTHLSMVLQQNGFSIVQVYSQTAASAKQLSDQLNVGFTNKYDDINKGADIYIYALKDSALETAISKINQPDAIHVHTAGSVSIDVFKAKAKKYGVIYPLQTFSKTKILNFKEVPLFIEGNNEATTSFLLDIAHQLSDHCYTLNSDQRKKVHLSAVFACNFTNLMYRMANELIEQTNLPFDILRPLIAETAAKVMYLSPDKAQTGPAVRYDINIISEHIKMLQDQPELLKVYKDLSDLIHHKSAKDC